MDKQNVVPHIVEYYPAIKRKYNADTRHSADEPGQRAAQGQKADTAGHMLYAPFIGNIQNWQIYENSKQNSCLGMAEREWGVTIT